jgi:hypothetical protein
MTARLIRSIARCSGFVIFYATTFRFILRSGIIQLIFPKWRMLSERLMPGSLTELRLDSKHPIAADRTKSYF